MGIGTANREDQTWPIAILRESARDLGLVTVRKGRLNVTAVARKHCDAPLGLWRHLLTSGPLSDRLLALNPTLSVLGLLAGRLTRDGRTGSDPAVTATI